jgi:TRAP-type C4-dicarboxylate transport system permease small subunit
MMFRRFENIVEAASRFVNILGIVVLLGMMMLIVTDVFLRYVFNKPVPGSVEVVEFMMGAVVFMGMAYTGIKKGHIGLGFLVSKMPERRQAFVDIFNFTVSTVFFMLVSWKSLVQTIVLYKSNQTSSVLGIPVYPFLIVLAVGSGLLALVFLIFTVHSFSRAAKR